MAVAPARNPYHYAIVVGISHYAGLATLAGPVNDATNFAKWLLDPAGGGLPESNIQKVITRAEEFDPKQPTPTKGDVDDAFAKINMQARNDMGDSTDRREASRLWVFLSGHGIMPADGEGALLMANATAGRMGENIELRAYTDWQVRTGLFSEVVMFADCCRNWESRAPRGLPPFTSGEPAGQVRDLVGYAADQNQVSREQTSDLIDPSLRRGFFTKALIDGLRGEAAAAPARTEVTAASLATYLRAAVAAATAPDYQRPSMRGEWVDDLVLARLPEPPPQPVVVIGLPPNLTAPVTLVGTHTNEQVWWPERGDWKVGVWPGLYELTSSEGATGVDVGLLKVDEIGGSMTITPRQPTPADSRLTSLTVRATAPGTSFTVVGEYGRTPVATGGDRLTARLPAGIYEVTATAGANDQSHLVRLGGPRPQVAEFDPRPWACAPIPGTTAEAPDELAAVEQASAALAAVTGAVAGLIVMVRGSTAATSVELVDSQGHAVPLAPAGVGVSWVILSKAVPPGGYLLRTRQTGPAAGVRIERPVCVSSGWQTLLFVTADEHGPDPQAASVHMTAIGSPWHADSADSLAIESLADTARVGRAITVSTQLLELSTTTPDPILKLLMANAILAQLAASGTASASTTALQDHLVALAADLDQQLPSHPDVRALRAAVRLRNGERPRVSMDLPPMLADSYWQYLLPASRAFPGVITAGSRLASAARNARPGRPWFTWSSPADDQVASSDKQTQDDHHSPLAEVTTFARAAAARSAVTVAHVIDTVSVAELTASLELPTSLIAPAVDTIRSQLEYLDKAVLRIAPDVRYRTNARVLDPNADVPVAAEPGRLGSRPRSTVYVADSLLIGGADEDALSAAAARTGCTLEDDPRFPALAERARHYELDTNQIRALRRVRIVAAHPEVGPDAWVVKTAYHAMAPAGSGGVSLDHVLVARLGDPTPTTSGAAESSPVGVRPGPDGHLPMAWLGAVPSRQDNPNFDRRRPVVAVLDTSVGPHDWLTDAIVSRRPTFDGVELGTGSPFSNDPFDLDRNDPSERRETESRATFMAGLVRQTCPDADIVAVPITASSTAATEGDLVLTLSQLVLQQQVATVMMRPDLVVDVVVTPHGFYSEDEGIGTSALRELVDQLGRLGVIVVAAAGDDGSVRPRFPGGWADPGNSALTPDRVPIINVGSLDPGGAVSSFTNAGPSVWCYRAGAVVVSTMPVARGRETQPAMATGGARASIDPDDVDSAFAVWSGTAFAAAVLAGQLAAGLATSPLDDISTPARVDAAWDAVQSCVPLVRP